ncbi:U6 snRNA-associated Sm-like protein [Schistosoma japonicum]|uniref:U6 snRNA-associated Sm-like protein n=1 Tax=Schistosoma japonicum TaxID=6182 RepID=A0A4Z2D5U0_SCHJA|nr:U6 snRNA-associated Sm-like protein [Schistosoma japonicum]
MIYVYAARCIQLINIIISNSPTLLSVKNCFIRGSIVRYVQLPADECDTIELQNASRKEATVGKQPQN